MSLFGTSCILTFGLKSSRNISIGKNYTGYRLKGVYKVEAIHEALFLIIDLSVLFFEMIGVILIIVTGLRGVYILFIKKKTKHHWLKSLLTALSFLLLAEVLETVKIRTINQLFTVGGLFGLRAIMVLYIDWERKHDEHKEIQIQQYG